MLRRLITPGSVMIVSIMLLSCSEDPYPAITEDYCATTPVTKAGNMSQLDELLVNRDSVATGVMSLEEGDQSMVLRAWLTDAAESSIDIQYFIFSSDNVGLIAADYLLRAADRGVKVRIIVDDIMVEADADDLLALDSHPNLSIKIYNPNANIGKNIPVKIGTLAADFRGFNQRMHNKTFIVDEKVAITGGRNIADEYFDYDHEYNFRDRDILLLNGVVSDLDRSFEEFWNDPSAVSVTDVVIMNDEDLNTEIKYQYLHQYSCNPDNFWPVIRERINAIPEAIAYWMDEGIISWVQGVSFVSDMPGKNEGDEGLQGGGLSTDSLIALVRSAKESIWIQSPYLITTSLGTDLFREAVSKGVEVHILTNSLSSTDNLEAFSGYKRSREDLLSTGVNIYEFRPDAAVRYEVMTGSLQKKINFKPKFGLHAKTMVIDDRLSVIGTFNLDPRSANLNTECITIVRDPDFSAELRRVIEIDMLPENAWVTTIDENPDHHAGGWKRFQLWLRGIVPKSVL